MDEFRRPFQDGQVTLIMPTIVEREGVTLERASRSVRQQTRRPDWVDEQCDVEGRGAALVRHEMLNEVMTEWVTFLDDDDELDPHHLETLLSAAYEHDADYVWSRFRIGRPDGTTSPGPQPLGMGTFRQWDDDRPAQTTITTLVRTEVALAAGGFAPFVEDPARTIDGQRHGEDFDFTLRCRRVGGTFYHVPEVTWTWHHWNGNTSGLPPKSRYRKNKGRTRRG